MIRFFLTALVIFAAPQFSKAQLSSFIGQTENYIYQNLKDCNTLEERGLEHQEFDILVCTADGYETSFFYKFYKGDKLCQSIRVSGKRAAVDRELNFVAGNFRKVDPNSWVSKDSTVSVTMREQAGEVELFYNANFH